jgi:hypothetical protein
VQGFGVQTPAWVQVLVPVQFACVVTVQVPAGAQHEPVTTGGTIGSRSVPHPVPAAKANTTAPATSKDMIAGRNPRAWARASVDHGACIIEFLLRVIRGLPSPESSVWTGYSFCAKSAEVKREGYVPNPVGRPPATARPPRECAAASRACSIRRDEGAVLAGSSDHFTAWRNAIK